MAVTERLSPKELKNAFLKVLELPPPPPGPSQPLPPVITLPLFVMGLRNLAQGIVTRGAKQSGWQFLTVGPGDRVISGDVPNWDPGTQPPAASRSLGPALEKAFAAWESLKNLDQVQKADIDYEPVALRIPGLHIEALWLRKRPFSEELDQDIVVPFQSFNKQLAARPFFSMPAFLRIVQPLADQQLRIDTPRD